MGILKTVCSVVSFRLSVRNAANDLAFAVGVELQVRGGAEDGGDRDGREVLL